jgi:hypothetical protein
MCFFFYYIYILYFPKSGRNKGTNRYTLRARTNTACLYGWVHVGTLGTNEVKKEVQKIFL